MSRSYERETGQDSPRSSFRAGPQKSSGGQPVSRPARRADPDACPSGYDQDIWGLVLLFGQLAAADGIHLAAGRPLLYAMLEERVRELQARLEKAQKLEPRSGWWSATPGKRFGTWQELAEAAIRFEWANFRQDQYAADWFCDPTRFREMIRQVRHRAYFAHLDQKMRELRAEREASGYYDEQEQQRLN